MKSSDYNMDTAIDLGRLHPRHDVIGLRACALYQTRKTAPTFMTKMADHLAIPKAKQGITRERKLFSKLRQLKTFRVQRRLD